MDNDGPHILRGQTHNHDLGTGGTATAALWRRDPLVVLKTVDSDLHYEQEVHALGHVLPPHKGIVYLFDCQTGDLTAFPQRPTRLLLEYCDGGDLHHCLLAPGHHDRLPEAFVWHVFLRLAEALAFMHAGWSAAAQRPTRPWTTVLHHDLKTQNVFLKRSAAADAYPDVVIGDFGHARVPSADTWKKGFAIGTPEFDPPEAPFHTEKGDVWGLGAILLQMIDVRRAAPLCANPWGPVGRNLRHEDTRPAWAETPERWERHAAQTWPESRYLRQPREDAGHHYSKRLYYWIARCMAYDPHDRPSAVELAREMTPEARAYRDTHYEPLSFVQVPGFPGLAEDGGAS